MVFARYGGTHEHRGGDKPGREKFELGHLVSPVDGSQTASGFSGQVTAATHSFKETSLHATSLLREIRPASDQH
jgi:hypothetical protein